MTLRSPLRGAFKIRYSVFDIRHYFFINLITFYPLLVFSKTNAELHYNYHLIPAIYASTKQDCSSQLITIY